MKGPHCRDMAPAKADGSDAGESGPGEIGTVRGDFGLYHIWSYFDE